MQTSLKMPENHDLTNFAHFYLPCHRCKQYCSFNERNRHSAHCHGKDPSGGNCYFRNMTDMSQVFKDGSIGFHFRKDDRYYFYKQSARKSALSA